MQLLPRRARRAVAKWLAKELNLNAVDSGRGWFTLFESGETHIGGWQQDEQLSPDRALANYAVYACATLIASDIGKICIDLKERKDGVWVATDSPSFSPVLRKPNHFQTRQQFVECWVLSKLVGAGGGNAYILKVRDNRNVVTRLYVLDPSRVTTLVADDGSVYYRLDRDPLSRQPHDDIIVPASEIIHDRLECLFHPLVGVSPLVAANMPALQSGRIQQHSESFFKNQSRPGGMLTAPDRISPETAERLKTEFERKFSGENRGRLFVGGDGLEFNAIGESAVNSQLVEQLQLTAEQVCSAFHVPAYMIGVGKTPSYDNQMALQQQYFAQCLHKLFNAIEDLLDDGIGLTAAGYRSEFDLGDLIRMDPEKQAVVLEKLSQRGIISPNEGRAKFGYLPVTGGESPMIQVQNASLAAIAKRDAKDDPFATSAPSASAPKETSADEDKAANDDEYHGSALDYKLKAEFWMQVEKQEHQRVIAR